MEQQLDSRAAREKEAYEHGLRRDLYDSILDHSDLHYRRKRFAVAGAILRARPLRRALELGSMTWRDFLEQNGVFPDEVVCINISDRELAKGIERARTTRMKPRFLVMDAQQLEFPDAHFDLIFGNSILHHLDFERALREIARVLKPDGLLLFDEPLDNNPVGKLVRKLTPEARTADEQPLRFSHLATLQRHFRCELHYEEFFSVPAGVLSRLLFRDPDNPLTRLAFRVDELLLRGLPALGPLYRRVLIVGHKPPAGPGS